MKNKKGFTILELIAVIFILSLVILLFISSYGSTTNKIVKEKEDFRETVLGKSLSTYYYLGKSEGTLKYYISDENKIITCIKLSTLIENGYLAEEDYTSKSADTFYKIEVGTDGIIKDHQELADINECKYNEINISNVHQGATNTNDAVLGFQNLIKLFDVNIYKVDVNFTYNAIGPQTSIVTIEDLIRLRQPFKLHTGRIVVAETANLVHAANNFEFTITPLGNGTQSSISFSRNPRELFLDPLVQFTDVHITRANGTVLPLNIICSTINCTDSREPISTTVDNEDLIGTTITVCAFCFWNPHNTGGCASANTNDLRIETTTIAEYTTALVEYEINSTYFKLVDTSGAEIPGNKVSFSIDLTKLAGNTLNELFNFNIKYRNESNLFAGSTLPYITVEMINSIKVTFKDNNGILDDIVQYPDPTSTVYISKVETYAIN